jgi:exodeoxyribonuclease V beta subunit
MSGSDEKLKTFFYVGDIKQSIYRFRGGAKELFDFVALQLEDELKVEILDTNYRSSQNIVKFINKIFNNISNYEYYPQKINSKNQGFVEVVDFDTLANEPYIQIKQKIQYLIDNKIDINNIAILTFTNKDVLNLYTYLKDKFPDLQITTEITSLLISEQNIKAVINIIKYLYFKEDIYMTNFNTLIGEDFFAPIDIKFDIFNTNLPNLIKDIAKYYSLLDANMIKFIEISKIYKNIVDFIYQIHRLDELKISEHKNGIQILTIFKSKGLEFDTVFVLDRIKRKNIDKSMLLFDYENLELNNIYLKNTNRENFDKNYKIAKQKEKNLTLEDDLNVLYVALTRAKNNLIVFKKMKNSAFDILGQNFNIQQLGKLFIDKIQATIPEKIINQKYQLLSLGLQEKPMKSIENTTQADIKYQYFGIATHYCLEMMGNFDKKSLNISINITKNKYSHILEENDFNDIYNRIKLLINNKYFLDMLKNAKIFKEQSLIYDNQIKILDLFVQKENSFLIFDYKTTIEQKNEHKTQVQLYKKAIKDIIKNNNVKSFLIYLQQKNVIIIEV